MIDSLKEEIADLVSSSSGIPSERILPMVDLSKEEFGDLSCRAAFLIAKERVENPAEIAADLAFSLKGKSDNFSRIDSAGPYLNFHLSNKAYSAMLSFILNSRSTFGSGNDKGKKALIEFPSVNPNKPWHIGHLRNAVLGESISRILSFDGYSVEKMDYIDDLGLQVAQSLWGVINLGNEPDGKFDQWIGSQYVEVSKKFESDKSVKSEVRALLAKMEAGDNEIAERGRNLAEECVKAQYQTSFDFGIHHDVLIFESDVIHELFKEGVKKLENSDAVIREESGKNKGCLVVRLDSDFGFGKLENPDKVLIRSDGTAVYTGKDVIFHLWKFGKMDNTFSFSPFIEQPNGKTAFMSSEEGMVMNFGNADKAINVIGVEQRYPQAVISEVFRRLGYSKEAENLHHLSYEHVGLPESRFSGRKGTWIGFTADDLLAEAKERVLEKIKIDVDESEKKSIAHKVGVSAIKFTFLRTNSDKKITFKWVDALNMQGDSGPYIQYAYVRCRGILSKSSLEPAVVDADFNDNERRLIKKLAVFRNVVARSSKELAPHHIPQYLLEVAGEFACFYASCPVIKAESGIRRTRLAIVDASSIVLRNGLGLLGIDCPGRM